MFRLLSPIQSEASAIPLHYGDFARAPYTSPSLEVAVPSILSLDVSISHSLHFIPLPNSLARSVTPNGGIPDLR